MEQTKDTNPTPGTQISAEQAGEVAGGTADCPTVTIGPVTLPGSSVGDALINAYDGAVDAASHVIETVAHAAK
jgi:hypothetical protein